MTTLENSDVEQNSKITTLEQATATQATQLTNLTSTVGQNTTSITTQQTVTDGLKAEYTLKVRQESNGQITVAGIGVASGQADDGETFSEIAFAAENFFFTTPNGLVHPMSIINIGTESNPDYKIMLDADVMINGQLSISQLQSGELQNGTALTVGQGSIEMSTASDGYGQIIITGAGGIATNDYLVIKEGRIESFVYTTSAGHVRYKEVRRNESGSATSGQQVTIPAYFKSQPVIHLAPRDISIYNASYPSQSQRLELEHSPVLPHPDIEGAWVFTPYCRLVLADGGKTETHGLTYVGGNNSQRWEVTGVKSLKKVTVNNRAASRRHTGSGNSYQNRKVTLALEYRPVGGSWTSGGSTSVNISQFNTHGLQVSKSLSQGTYDIAVVLTAQDRSGTFTSGVLQYDYTQANKAGSNWSKVLESPPGKWEYHQDYSQSITIGNPALSGWEITRIDYSARVQFTIKARTTYDGNWIMNGKVPGEAYIEVPNGSGGVTKYRVYSNTDEPVDYNNWRAEDSRDIVVNWSDSTYKDGAIRGPVKLFISKTGYTYSSMTSSQNYLPTAYASVTVSNITATVYYRKAKGQSSSASNTFYWDSSSYDLGATDISLTNSIIHWTATGE
ncbi:phage tail tip fiber protein [Endozoicomonas acroporae]|uniref:phage tail tip fiber protein n=1 Tax=Endozoicomonas acroporae TaxID=1701104 RepID=UPI000C77D429